MPSWFSTNKKGVPYDGNLTLADGKGKWWEGLDYVRIYQRSDIDSLLLTRDDPGGIPNYDGRKMKHVVSGKEVS